MQPTKPGMSTQNGSRWTFLHSSLLSAGLLVCGALVIPAASAQSLNASTTLKNVHALDAQKRVIRGAQPVGKSAELKKLKITDVLIIKQQTRGEVDKELAELQAAGIRTQVIPMKWSDVEAREVCHQIVEAVQTLQKLKRQGKRVYFHCTAGEDRTGAVAGLFRMVDQGWTAKRAFEEELCARGYSDGNPGKPRPVTSAIESSLTPAFWALSKSANSETGLNPSECNRIDVTSARPALSCKKLGIQTGR
jgi:protein-tyrosine phosphatase